MMNYSWGLIAIIAADIHWLVIVWSRYISITHGSKICRAAFPIVIRRFALVRHMVLIATVQHELVGDHSPIIPFRYDQNPREQGMVITVRMAWLAAYFCDCRFFRWGHDNMVDPLHTIMMLGLPTWACQQIWHRATRFLAGRSYGSGFTYGNGARRRARDERGRGL